MKFLFRAALMALVLLLAACNPMSKTPEPTPTTVSAAALPLPPHSAPARHYAITDVAIVDVENGTVVPGQTVIVADDKIERIGAHGTVDIPQGAHVVNGHGLYLMPGLVDAHVHYLDAPVFGRLMLANGVLLVRDMGMPNEFILPLRDGLNHGETLGPAMIATGAMLDGDPPLIPLIALSGIKTPEEGRAAVHKQAAAGVNEIKVYSGLDDQVFRAIIDEAHKVGLKVVGHVPDSMYLEDAATAGLDSIEHWFGFEKVIAKLSDEAGTLNNAGMGADAETLGRLGKVEPERLTEFYQRLRASGVTVVPTIVTFKNFPNVDALERESLPQGEFISPSVFSMWKAQWSGQTKAPDLVWQNWAEMVRAMNDAGLPLMVGTDLMVPGVIPGFAVHEEMMIWQEAGVPTADVLRAATFVPAQFMGLGDSLGSITQGKTASMVLVRANPLADIKNAQQIESVFLRGRYLDRNNLNQLLAEAKEFAAHSTP